MLNAHSAMLDASSMYLYRIWVTPTGNDRDGPGEITRIAWVSTSKAIGGIHVTFVSGPSASKKMLSGQFLMIGGLLSSVTGKWFKQFRQISHMQNLVSSDKAKKKTAGKGLCTDSNTVIRYTWDSAKTVLCHQITVNSWQIWHFLSEKSFTSIKRRRKKLSFCI